MKNRLINALIIIALFTFVVKCNAQIQKNILVKYDWGPGWGIVEALVNQSGEIVVYNPNSFLKYHCLDSITVPVDSSKYPTITAKDIANWNNSEFGFVKDIGIHVKYNPDTLKSFTVPNTLNNFAVPTPNIPLYYRGDYTWSNLNQTNMNNLLLIYTINVDGVAVPNYMTFSGETAEANLEAFVNKTHAKEKEFTIVMAMTYNPVSNLQFQKLDVPIYYKIKK